MRAPAFLGGPAICDCQHSQSNSGAPAGALGAVSAVPLLSGDAGVAQTVALMRRAIDSGLKNARLRALVIKILRDSGAPQHDPLAEAAALYSWVPANLRFVNDPIDTEGDPKETVSAAVDVLDLGGGDCDDFTVVMATLLQIAGMQTRIVTVASDPRDPSQFTHVYPEVDIDGQWVPVDAARPGAAFGLAPSRVYRRKEWSADSAMAAALSGFAHAPARRFALSGYHHIHSGLRKLPMGDDTQDLSQLITAAGQASADELLAINAAPQNIYGQVNTGQPSYSAGSPLISPYAGYPTTATVTSPFGTISSTGMLLLLGIGLLGVAFAFRK